MVASDELREKGDSVEMGNVVDEGRRGKRLVALEKDTLRGELLSAPEERKDWETCVRSIEWEGIRGRRSLAESESNSAVAGVVEE